MGSRQGVRPHPVDPGGQWEAGTGAGFSPRPRPVDPGDRRAAGCGAGSAPEAPPCCSDVRRMWALRATVRGGAWLSRAVRGCRPPRAALLPPPPRPERALAAVRGGLGCSEGREGGRGGPRAGGRRSRADGEEEPEDAEEEDDKEELLRRDPLLPSGTQRVCLVHPEIKWGPGKPQGTRGDRERGVGRSEEARA